MGAERVDYSSDSDFQQAQQEEAREYERQEAERQEAESQLDEQQGTYTDLENSLMATRDNFKGISIRDVARIIKSVFDKAEMDSLIRELGAEKIPVHEDDLPF